MKKDNIYLLYQREIKDKDTAVLSIIRDTLVKTRMIFVWDGLPETVPATEMEKMLQTCGHCFFTSVDGVLYALSGGLGGEVDAYGRPTVYTVANPALNLNKNYLIQDDGVLMENDTERRGLLPVIGKYSVLLTDAIISLNIANVLSRITMLISASDDKTKESADTFVKKILDGDFSVIGENAFFKGVNMQTAPTAGNNLMTQLIETVQYLKAGLCNELGLNANYNMKRERLNLGEVSMNVDVLLPMVDNMLQCRQNAAAAINERYGLNVSVSLGSSWKLQHENYEKLVIDTTVTNAPTSPTDDDSQQEQDGTAGTDGTDGTTGTDGTDGTAGTDGTDETDDKEEDNEI